jgi:hypothetical protein
VRKLAAPKHDPLATFDACVNAISNTKLRTLFVNNRADIHKANRKFDVATANAAWSGLPRVPKGNADILVAGSLCKRHLVELYTKYMVGTRANSRNIYDDILTAAGGFCPFCGGLGHAETLDHYLPKANFPSFSVHPSNLVPCCRRCNSAKKALFGMQEHEQTLHPYLDRCHLFEARWIIATVDRVNPVLVKFKCEPPSIWSLKDKKRVRNHFLSYELASRFSIQAGSEVAKVIQLRISTLSRLSANCFREYLLENANCQDFVLNGWSRTMYNTLASTDWFVQTDFQDPNWHL